MLRPGYLTVFKDTEIRDESIVSTRYDIFANSQLPQKLQHGKQFNLFF